MIGILSENGNRNIHRPTKRFILCRTWYTFWLLNPLKWFLVRFWIEQSSDQSLGYMVSVCIQRRICVTFSPDIQCPYLVQLHLHWLSFGRQVTVRQSYNQHSATGCVSRQMSNIISQSSHYSTLPSLSSFSLSVSVSLSLLLSLSLCHCLSLFLPLSLCHCLSLSLSSLSTCLSVYLYLCLYFCLSCHSM